MKTILVIEDDPAIRNNIAMILKSQGFTILQAEDGLTGVELALGASPDLIVCDIMLPEISGYEILEQLRQVPESAVTPFIFLTALADRSDMRQGMNLGADDYLTKPFSSQELIGAVNARLQKQQELMEPYRNEMRKATDKLRQMVYTDLLTNLPNRIFLWQKIDERVANLFNAPFALVLVKLSNLDKIVETEGHSTADLLLQSLARSLESLVDESDLLSRCQPDCFGILRTQSTQPQEIEQWLKPLIREWIPTYAMGQRLIDCDLKIAIAPYPLAGQTTVDLVRSAEQVLEQQLQSGSSIPYAFYTEELQQNLSQTDRLCSALEVALDRQEFEIYYQPIVNTITGRVIGIEAVLHWNHPEFQDLDPQSLINAVRGSQEQAAIEQWMLNTAFNELQVLQSHYLSPLKIAIAVSKDYVNQPNFVETIQTQLQQANIDPSLVILGIQESDILEAEESLSTTLEILKDHGIQIALEDFGTGYASVTHLSRLPLHYLKVDRAIIQTLPEDSHSTAILKTIITLAQSLRLKVIAKGVETEEQLAFLRKQGCPMMQGSFYSPPLPAAEVVTLLADERRLS